MLFGVPSWLLSQAGTMLSRCNPATRSFHSIPFSSLKTILWHHSPNQGNYFQKSLPNIANRPTTSIHSYTCSGRKNSRHRFSKPCHSQNFLPWPASTSSREFKTLSSSDGHHKDVMLAPLEMQEVLGGIAAATLVPQHAMKPVSNMFLSCQVTMDETKRTSCDLENRALSYHQWSASIASAAHDSQSKLLANLALVIAFLRRKSRLGQIVREEELASAWSHMHAALNSPLLKNSMPGPSRSAQGFLAIPLCSLVRNGNIDVLFRLHVWLPDGQRGSPGFSIHSHQPFACSWVLAGEGRDTAYKVSSVATKELATHAEYALTWTDGKDKAPDTNYKSHQVYSKIVNTRQWVSAVVTKREVHTRNMSYSIPAASFHRTEVRPDTVHATLFLFDSEGGFIRDAPVLGPVDSESSVQVRKSGDANAAVLSDLINSIRKFEGCKAHASELARHRNKNEAFAAFQEALQSFQSLSRTLDWTHYQRSLVSELRMMVAVAGTETATREPDRLQWLAKLDADLQALGEQC
jgi:hypothetical protein